MLLSIISFFTRNRTLAGLLFVVMLGWGLSVSPFEWTPDFLPRNPISVDAIPDLGENQQIVFTDWEGRSPKDVEDQITYPLTTALLGVSGVKTVRSTSMFGFSSIFVIFDEGVDFYWSRARLLEKLNALPPNLLPDGVRPSLGPDATGLGQVFWYTLEGRDADGKPNSGWDLHELRRIQDFQVGYALAGVQGVAEVAPIGGFVKQYQVFIHPERMRELELSTTQVLEAVRGANSEVGARTLEFNRAEYIIRGLGYIQSLADIEQAVIVQRGNVPIYVKDVAHVQLGPAERRGILDKSGAEVVGGVVTARYGENPQAVIARLKEQIATVSIGLPEKQLDDGSLSKVTIVPFYDRSGLIRETLGTLEEALVLQVLITVFVVVALVLHLRSAIMISLLLPFSVLMCFIMMKYTGIEANIVALSGIAIAIGTVVDMGVILTENILQSLEKQPNVSLSDTIIQASAEVGSAIVTAVSTTIISFLPVFTMESAEGKLFKPLAYTKTYVLLASIFLTLTLLPVLARWMFAWKTPVKVVRHVLYAVMSVLSVPAFMMGWWWAGFILLVIPVLYLVGLLYPAMQPHTQKGAFATLGLGVLWLLAEIWLPLGAMSGMAKNGSFILLITGVLIGFFFVFYRWYERLLRWCLSHKMLFLSIPLVLFIWGMMIWLGFPRLFGWVAKGGDSLGFNIRTTAVYSTLTHTFPGLGREFMPPLDEGTFLLMPTVMPHAGVEEVTEILQELDMRVTSIPEVAWVVGKAGRAESALDPAPMSMFENLIQYKSEYILDEHGRRMRFATGKDGALLKDEQGRYIPDARGSYVRQWRDHISSTDDIWNEIVQQTQLPGVTGAPKLQPIETRLVMLQSGMRAPMGIKVKGNQPEQIEAFALELERLLKEVPQVKAEAVFAERVAGKPYLLIQPKREKLAQYGLSVAMLNEQLELALGGMLATQTVEGRQRYDVTVRYAKGFRDEPDDLSRLLINVMDGVYVPLGLLAEVRYEQGPEMIRAEDTFLTAYVLFDRQAHLAEVEVVEAAQHHLNEALARGEIKVPAGISYEFAGSYQNQVRAIARLKVILPLALMLIFMILYLQFRSGSTSMMIFTAIFVAWSGGFIMIWLYAQPWFMDVSYFGVQLREVFGMGTINMSVAVWVGFIALFGIATDDGVVMATYLQQTFKQRTTTSIAEIREAVVEAGLRRIRPCLMTSATTIMALLPVLTSTGKGAGILIPMAIPTFGGMLVVLITLFVVPVLYAAREEYRITRLTDSEVN